jgi:hypothetical protein
MALTWTLEEINAKVRELSGRPSTNQISDSDLNDQINDFYTLRFVNDIRVTDVEGYLTQATTVADDGEYAVLDSVLRIENPMLINGEFGVTFHQEKDAFFNSFILPDTFVTNPTLSAGTDTKKVANVAFDYEIQRRTYSKAATETALSGNTIPQGKYGAFALEIDENGTITLVESDKNTSGALTQAIAVENLAQESSDSSTMGFVTVINSSGDFVPGTTALDASGVTATFTDGNYTDRARPTNALLWNNILWLRPRPDDIYRFRAASRERPSPLTSGVAPLDASWGLPIAYGTAILLKDSNNEDTLNLSRSYKDLTANIRRKRLSQEEQSRIARREF